MYLLNYPFLKFLGPYIIGIILAYYFKYPINDIFFIGLNVLLLAGYALFRHYRLILFILCNLSWNYTSSLLEAKPFSEAFYQTAHDVQFELAEFPKIREKTLQVQAVMLTLDSIPQRVNVMLTIAKDSQSLKLTHSDRIWAKVKLKAIEAAKNPYMFDYKNYMRLKSVHYTAYIPSGSWIFKTT